MLHRHGQSRRPGAQPGKTQNYCETGISDGIFDVDDIAGTAMAIFSLCIDVARWYSPRTSRTPEQIGQLYGDIALRMISSRPAVVSTDVSEVSYTP